MKILLLTLVGSLLTPGLNSQQNFKASSYSIQINFNYNRAVLELSGKDYISENIYDGKTFGADKGFGVSVYSVLPLGKKSGVCFIQALSFNRMLSYDFGSVHYDIGEANYNTFTVSLGFNYNFSPGGKYKIYLGPELNASIISGTSKIWFEKLGNLLGDSVASYNIGASLRMGFGLYAGAVYYLNKKIGVNIGARFLNLNAFLRSTGGKAEDNEFKLRDENNISLIFSGKKSFAFISLFAGISLSL